MKRYIQIAFSVLILITVLVADVVFIPRLLQYLKTPAFLIFPSSFACGVAGGFLWLILHRRIMGK